MHTSTSIAVPSLDFADLIDPMLHTRSDIDGATVELDPIEQAALDVAVSLDLDADDWVAFGTLVQQPKFVTTLAALCAARSAEARRVQAHMEACHAR